MAYFRCGQGGGAAGGGYIINITTESASLYGQPIVIRKNGSVVGTTVFDSQGTASYTVDEPGTYTVSVTVSGVTFSDTVTIINEFDASIEATPEGSTALPTDDVQILLHCADIWDKNYTTISELLADTTSLLTVISSHNAIDYLVRSHTWCADICADSTAMTYIGTDNYASDTLLSDSGSGNWLDAICNSTYFENVLNVKVPTMTSNTTPSGVVSASSVYDSSATYAPWHVFDGNSNTLWNCGHAEYATNTAWVGYTFTEPVKIYKAVFNLGTIQSGATYEYRVIARDGSESFTDVSQVVTSGNTIIFKPTEEYSQYALRGSRTTTETYSLIYELQFYGREDV